MARPGPGEVLRFAEEVKSGWRDTDDRARGVRSALAWVLGERNEHPVASKPAKGKGHPPNMNQIRRAGRDAFAAGRRATSDGSSMPTRDYYKGVRECLSWISSGKRKPRRT